MSYVSTWRDRAEEILTIARMVKDANPAAWEEVKVHGQKSRRFINLVSMSCINAGIPAGVNLKRGGPEESLDALALPNATGARDSMNKFPGLEIVDIVVSAERADARIDWVDVTQATIDGGTIGGWKAGSLVTQPPQPPPAPMFPYPDEVIYGLAFQAGVKRAYNDAGRQFPDPNDSDAFRHFIRLGYSFRVMPPQEAIAKHLKELRAQLGVSPE